jgi:hypothetical protein
MDRCGFDEGLGVHIQQRIEFDRLIWSLLIGRGKVVK